MKTYLIKWPNGTISVMTARSDFELCDKMDAEGDPTDSDVEIYELPKEFHLTTEVKVKSDKEFSIECEQSFEHGDAEMRKCKFTKNMGVKYISKIGGGMSKKQAEFLKGPLGIS
jgi:hypothetical protein